MNKQSPDDRHIASELQSIEGDATIAGSDNESQTRHRVLSHFDELHRVRQATQHSPLHDSEDLIVLPELEPSPKHDWFTGWRRGAVAAAALAFIAGIGIFVGTLVSDENSQEIQTFDDGSTPESGGVQQELPQINREGEGADTSDLDRSGDAFFSVALPAGATALPTLGGVQLDLPEPSRVLVSEGCVLAFAPGYSEPAGSPPFVLVGQIGFSGVGGGELAPLATVDDWAELIAESTGVAPEATGERRELLGQTLLGFKVQGLSSIEPGQRQLNCSPNAEATSRMEFFPTGVEEWFVAEVEGGLLIVASGASTEPLASEAALLRDELLSTIQQVEPPTPFDHGPEDGQTVASSLVDLRPANLGDRARSVTFPALGGVRFDVDPDHDVYAYGDSIIIDPIRGASSHVTDVARLGLLTQTVNGRPISTASEFLDEISSVSSLEVRPNGHTIDLFGLELAGYTVQTIGSLPFAQSVPQSQARLQNRGPVFAHERIGADVFGGWIPQNTHLFVAETAAGLLYVGFDINPFVEGSVAREAFSNLVDTAELTGVGLDSPLPDGITFGGSGATPETSPETETLTPFFGQFTQESGSLAGRFHLQNFGVEIGADLTGWTVNENSPGALRFQANRLGAHGFDQGSVVMLVGVEESLRAIQGGPSAADETADLADFESFLNSPPSNLLVSDVVETRVGGLDAFRFDIQITPGASCGPGDPCAYAFEPSWDWGIPAFINPEYSSRGWWLPDHPQGPALIWISDYDPTFVEGATEFVESMEALR